MAKIKVDDRLLRAADRMYDVLAALAGPGVPERLAGLRVRLERARDGYDAAMEVEDE